MTTDLYSPQMTRALIFAAEWHGVQQRKCTEPTPFLLHPFRVAHLLAEAGELDETLFVATILHDVLEDTDCPESALSAAFGTHILSIVRELTDNKSLPKAERKRRQIERAGVLTPSARLIRIADKIDNVRDLIDCPPAGWDLQRKQDYLIWARRVVNRIRGTHPKLERMFDDVCEETRLKLG